MLHYKVIEFNMTSRNALNDDAFLYLFYQIKSTHSENNEREDERQFAIGI